MRTSLLVVLMGLFSLTVSCAHKNVEEKKPVAKEVKKEKAVAVKVIKEEKKNRSYTCLVGKDQRTVSLDREAKRCQVHYTKEGERQQVAWAENTQDICDRAFNSIRSNIENGGFACNDGDSLIQKDKKEEVKKPLKTAAK